MDPVVDDRRRRSVLPPHLQTATFGDVLYHLAHLAPEDVRALEVLARQALEDRWRERFYGGSNGGATH